MSLKRTDQVNVDQTAYYHCTARCVRRAYLCGDDPRTGGSFDHRRDWLVARIQSVASTYSVGVCAYAILPDHFHLIVRLDRNTALAWSDDVVAER